MSRVVSESHLHHVEHIKVPDLLWDPIPDANYRVTYPDMTINLAKFPQYYQSIWLLEDQHRAWDYVAEFAPQVDPTPRATPGPTLLRWKLGVDGYPEGCGGNCQCTGSCYLGGSVAFISDASILSPDTAVHELGHLYYHRASGLSENACPRSHSALYLQGDKRRLRLDGGLGRLLRIAGEQRFML